MKYYPRPELANELADAMLGKQMFSDAPNGLFLAAPRRTGKTAFLQSDLKPALERKGALVIYADLWSKLGIDPAEYVSQRIAEALGAHQGMISKAAKAVGLDSITIAGSFKMDLSKIGSTKGTSFFDSLRLLRSVVKKPVALILDEAQHALTSDAGEAMMFELKSARDQMNTPDRVDLMLVMSGSDRDKLLRLVNSNAAPFFGSEVKQMPLLGVPFIEHLSHLIEAQRPDLVPVNSKKLLTAFQQYGCRPQIFSENLGRALNPLYANKARFEITLLKAAKSNQAQEELAMANAYLALLPLEQVVLWRILDLGARFRPYNADNLRMCSEKTGEKITATMVQKILEGLRAHQPSMIWKSARGEYAIDDTAMMRWYETEVKAGRWPPTPTPDAESALASRF